MVRALRIARTVGIWVFGLTAYGAIGSVVGTSIRYAYENQSDTGMVAGLCAFACFRLWMGERKS
jgi:hypothetical protein